MIEATPRTLFTWFAHRTFVLLSRRWPRTLHSNIMVEILPFHTWFMRLAQIYHCTLRIIHASCVGHILSALTTAAGGHGTAKLKDQSIQKTGRRRPMKTRSRLRMWRSASWKKPRENRDVICLGAAGVRLPATD